jgi:hypothetical protein
MIGVAEKGRDFAAALRLGTGDVASIRAGLQMSIFAARLQKKNSQYVHRVPFTET